MNGVELRAHPFIVANINKGLRPLAQAIQMASNGSIGFTASGIRIGDLSEQRISDLGLNTDSARQLIARTIEQRLRPGNYPVELLLAGKTLDEIHRTHLPFVVQDIVPAIESRQLKVFMLGGAGSGVVSAVHDLVNAFCSAGYYGRAFPMFDPSKKGAPVRGYGIVSRDPILSHAPFEVPDIVLLFDSKLFPLLRLNLDQYENADPNNMAILINTPMNPSDFRAAADFHEPHLLFTLDVGSILAGTRIPPNYAMIGGMLGILGKDAVDQTSFIGVVESSLTNKFGPGDKVTSNVAALKESIPIVREEAQRVFPQSALGKVESSEIPEGQIVLCENGNKAIAAAMRSVLNLFPSVIAVYPCTPQTEIAEHLSQMAADENLSSVIVTPESEHAAGGAIMGAARDNVLCFTAISSIGGALMSEVLHTIAGQRMANVVVSDVVRALNAPLNVQNGHDDLNKIILDAGFLTFMTRNVQGAYDFHLMSYLAGMYAQYRELGNGLLEMIPDKSVMLPTVVASEGFEVSHAPERYLALTDKQVAKLYGDPFFNYIATFVQPGRIIGANKNVMGAIMIDNARHDTDYQRHVAMNLAYEVLKTVFAKFEEYTGRKYDFIHQYNATESDIVFVVAGAANGTFEEVASEFKERGINVGVVHPNVLRPFPKSEWAKVLAGKKVFVYDRDDPFGAVGGRLYTELAGVVNEYGIDSKLFSRIYGLGGRTPSLSLVRDEIHKALRFMRGEIELSPGKHYVGVKI